MLSTHRPLRRPSRAQVVAVSNRTQQPDRPLPKRVQGRDAGHRIDRPGRTRAIGRDRESGSRRCGRSQRSLVWRAIQLAPDQRNVMLLGLVGGPRSTVVAEIVGKTVGAVKQLQHRALLSACKDPAGLILLTDASGRYSWKIVPEER